MEEIFITTQINCSPQIVFDLSRSINLHLVSTAKTGEEAVAGVTNGLINIDEEVTWKARHLFKTRFFTSRITDMQPPLYFKDEMQKGDFKKFIHEHFFNQNEAGTLMKDKILLQSPYGLAGKLADKVFLKNYIRNFLIERNAIIKYYAETGEWKKILQHT